MAELITQTYDMYEIENQLGYRQWLVKEDDVITPVLMATGLMDKPGTVWLRNNVEAGMTALDVTAGSGYHTLLIAALVGPEGLVVAFESDPAWVAALEATRKSNEYDFDIIKGGLTREDDHDTLNYHRSMAHFNGPDFVRISANGYERQVWEGGTKIWASDLAPVVMLNYHSNTVNDRLLVPSLFEYGQVHRIEDDGTETEVTLEDVIEAPALATLVIRRY